MNSEYRHCEEQSDEAIHLLQRSGYGLLRFARNDDHSLFEHIGIHWHRAGRLRFMGAVVFRRFDRAAIRRRWIAI
jgi:hypothetical protein